MQLVYIPQGEFLMGSNDQDDPVSQPAHKVYLDAFWIDKTEVTNAMYAKCVQNRKCLEPLAISGLNPYYGKETYANDPVIYASWYYAKMYCSWAGRRLPTEAQWEKAARGSGDERLYPWGNKLPDMSLLNFDGNIGQPVAVDRYILGASPYGVLNMEGNLREWVADWFSPVYYQDLPYANPKGPPTGTLKSLRGSAYDDHIRESRVFERFGHDPTSAGRNRGFRCAVAARP
jgi:formylglycine-generating enzyme required for sulfatase activity